MASTFVFFFLFLVLDLGGSPLSDFGLRLPPPSLLGGPPGSESPDLSLGGHFGGGLQENSVVVEMGEDISIVLQGEREKERIVEKENHLCIHNKPARDGSFISAKRS